MNRILTAEQSLLHSALMRENRFQSLPVLRQWLAERQAAHTFSVQRIPFAKLEQWRFDEATGNLVHASGRFFSIEGLRVDTDIGGKAHWEQPIIHQPEVGILGIVTRVFGSTRHFLMQAKMEPGNIGTLQLSPTVQATRSNFTGVHAGRLPPYLDYFMKPGRARILVDQLQAEQGARFYRKRNRNMIVETDEEPALLPDFCWMTLHEIKTLLQEDNRVNMDTRSVIGCIGYAAMAGDAEGDTSGSFTAAVRDSFCDHGEGLHGDETIIAWLTAHKSRHHLKASLMPLRDIRGWVHGVDEIRHESLPLFSVIAVAVEAGSREVPNWTQPMLMDTQPGLNGMICSRINGVLHVLVQAKAEAGNQDIFELSPTVSCSHPEARLAAGSGIPFLELLARPKPDTLRYSALQSEEGGRFYRVQNRNTIIEIENYRSLELPVQFAWVTLSQIVRLMKFGYISIDTRTLLSCFPFLPA